MKRSATSLKFIKLGPWKDERGVGVKWISFTTTKKSNKKNILSGFVQFKNSNFLLKNKHVLFIINNQMTPEDRKLRVYI